MLLWLWEGDACRQCGVARLIPHMASILSVSWHNMIAYRSLETILPTADYGPGPVDPLDPNVGAGPPPPPPPMHLDECAPRSGAECGDGGSGGTAIVVVAKGNRNGGAKAHPPNSLCFIVLLCHICQAKGKPGPVP